MTAPASPEPGQDRQGLRRDWLRQDWRAHAQDLRAQAIDTRNRLIAHPRFQRWAAGSPLVKRVAAKRAADLFDLCAGFVYSQVLAALVELDLPTKLADGPKPLAALAAECNFTPEAMRQFLQAAEPLDLVERRGPAGEGDTGESYGLGSNGAALLGNPGVAAMVKHHGMLYRDLADPIALFRSGKADTELSRFWPYATADAPDALANEDVAAYSELMSSSLALLSDDVLDAYTLGGHGRLMDVGGGSGAFLVAAGRRRADLRLTLFDLPAVVERARARFAEEGLAERAQAIAGDFKRDPLPEGADAISLVRVAHDLDDEALVALLRKARAALPPAGVLLIAEPMAETAGARRVATYFTLYLKAMQRGRLRSVGELRRLLAEAGFSHVQQIPTARPMLASLLVARKAAYHYRSIALTHSDVSVG